MERAGITARNFVPWKITMPDSSQETQNPLVDSVKSEWAHLLNEGFAKIEHCVRQLTTEQIWWRPAAGLNSIGNLMLHLAGNLQQWAIVSQTNSPDRRNRAEEFSTREGLSREQLLERLGSVVVNARQAIAEISFAELLRVREVQGFQVNGLQAISHTVTHFGGHSHQVVLLTRLQLTDRYKFHWTPDSPRDQVPI